MIKLVASTIWLMLMCSSAFAAQGDTPIPSRIVSLAPSLTEMVYALGLGDRLVGVSTFCDYPLEAKAKPKVGGMSNPSMEAVLSARADIVLVTTDGNPQEFEQRLRAMGTKTYIHNERRLVEIPDSIRKLGAALGVSQRAEALAREIEQGMERYKDKAGNPAPRVIFVIWPEPLIVAGPGSLIHDAMQMMGMDNIAKGAAINYPKYSIEEVIAQQPDVVFIGSGPGMDTVSVKLKERIRSTPASRNGRIYYVSDKLYRFGPRVVAGMQELHEALQGKGGVK